jgi:hypothetical protein
MSSINGYLSIYIPNLISSVCLPGPSKHFCYSDSIYGLSFDIIKSKPVKNLIFPKTSRNIKNSVFPQFQWSTVTCVNIQCSAAEKKKKDEDKRLMFY